MRCDAHHPRMGIYGQRFTRRGELVLFRGFFLFTPLPRRDDHKICHFSVDKIVLFSSILNTVFAPALHLSDVGKCIRRPLERVAFVLKRETR